MTYDVVSALGQDRILRALEALCPTVEGKSGKEKGARWDIGLPVVHVPGRRAPHAKGAHFIVAPEVWERLSLDEKGGALVDRRLRVARVGIAGTTARAWIEGIVDAYERKLLLTPLLHAIILHRSWPSTEEIRSLVGPGAYETTGFFRQAARRCRGVKAGQIDEIVKNGAPLEAGWMMGARALEARHIRGLLDLAHGNWTRLRERGEFFEAMLEWALVGAAPLERRSEVAQAVLAWGAVASRAWTVGAMRLLSAIDPQDVRTLNRWLAVLGMRGTGLTQDDVCELFQSSEHMLIRAAMLQDARLPLELARAYVEENLATVKSSYALLDSCMQRGIDAQDVFLCRAACNPEFPWRMRLVAQKGPVECLGEVLRALADLGEDWLEQALEGNTVERLRTLDPGTWARLMSVAGAEGRQLLFRARGADRKQGGESTIVS